MEKANFDSILMQNILHHGNIGIHVINIMRRTLIYNEAMAKLEGVEVDSVLNKDLLDTFPSLNENTSTLIKVMNTGKSIINNTQSYLNYKGHSITTISTTLPLFFNEEIVGAMEIAQDITNIRRLSDRLIEVQGQLGSKKEKNKYRNIIKRYTFDDIIGNNEWVLRAKKIAEKASQSNSSVLIYGETGTGKEMFAQSIHYCGNRALQPFIAQNCAAIPETLLEGILFGTEKGGFTGAIEREGIFEQASGGTLLLDEINSMSLPLQAKLLRVLQEGYIRRIGGTKDIPIDVRIIATTNESPIEIMTTGVIRKDLFYRLSVININIPPIRERRDDIELLCQFFINKYNYKLNKKIQGISKDVLNRFLEYSWPGNVRELENFIEGAMNMVPEGEFILRDEDFVSTSYISSANSYSHVLKNMIQESSLPKLMNTIENELIDYAMKKNDNNITNAANYLGISRQNLQHKIKRKN